MKQKNINKTRGVLTGMAALLLTFGLVLAGCPQDSSDDPGGNTPETPDTVRVGAINIGPDDDETSEWWKAAVIEVEMNRRYVILDLSDCTFTNNTVTGSYNGAKGMNIFGGSQYIIGIILPAGVIRIGDYAFYRCTGGLTSVTIPAGVTSIGDKAFYGCYALTSVTTIPGTVTSIGLQAFYGCTALTSVTIPAGVTSIGVQAFQGCTALTSVTIQGGVTSIEGSAFQGCTALTSVTIPASVTNIVQNAFDGCTALTGITVDGANTAYSSEGGVLFNKAKTTLIRYPEGKSEVSYTIPASVTSIGNYAFSGTALTSVTIPADVTNIGGWAFSRCTALTSVTFAEGSSIADGDFGYDAFPEGTSGGGGNTLKTAYQEEGGGAGMYRRPANGETWEKQGA